MKTKFVALSVSLAMVPLAFSLSGCSGSDKSSQVSAAKKTQESAPKSPIAAATTDVQACNEVKKSIASANEQAMARKTGEPTVKDVRQFVVQLAAPMSDIANNSNLAPEFRSAAGSLDKAFNEMVKLIDERKLNSKRPTDPQEIREFEKLNVTITTKMKDVIQFCSDKNVNVKPDLSTAK